VPHAKAGLLVIQALFSGMLTGCVGSFGSSNSDAWISANSINYAPASRTLAPVAVYGTSGSVSNPKGMLSGGATRLNGLGSEISLDFGKEVGGIVTLNFAGASNANQSVGIAFTESSLFVGPNSDASNGGSGSDGAVYASVTGKGSYVMPSDKLRGGFRYLTIFMNSGGWVDLSSVSLHFTASPAMTDLRAYPNYFQSNDDLLNRIWYAGAYTVQLNTLGANQGRQWPPPTSGWENDAELGEGTSFLTDGAKRDRTIWPGDMGVSQTTAFVSTNDAISARGALNVLYAHQAADGGLPYCGPPVNFGTVSDTYHLWTLVASSDYYIETRDKAWLDRHWAQYKAGVLFSMNKIDSNGVFSTTLPADWGRVLQTGEELAANALLYHVLVTGAYLAQIEGDSSTAQTYVSKAGSLKQAANGIFWDQVAGEYRDAPGSSLYPQDGNSLAVWFGLANLATQSSSVSHALRNNWNTYGAQTPERPNAIATFPGSMEVLAHFAANDDQAGLDLMRLEWGYMLGSTMGTNSTFWEGYLADGSFDYQGNYMSNAHGWATGPTSALTYFVLGVAPEAAVGLQYHLIPHPGDLKEVAGRLTIPKGSIEASWEKSSDSATFEEIVTAPETLFGRIGLPTFGKIITVSMDGKIVWDGCNTTNPVVNLGNFDRASSDNNYVYFDGVKGSHTFIAKTSCSF
jgi:hypothetical protein